MEVAKAPSESGGWLLDGCWLAAFAAFAAAFSRSRIASRLAAEAEMSRLASLRLVMLHKQNPAHQSTV